jgi:hypothetical protein
MGRTRVNDLRASDSPPETGKPSRSQMILIRKRAFDNG